MIKLQEQTYDSILSGYSKIDVIIEQDAGENRIDQSHSHVIVFLTIY